jgi:hypothetical protein
VKQDLYTVDQVHVMVSNSSTTNESVNLEDRDDVFKDWKKRLEPLYRDVKAIRNYQLFNFEKGRPGVVICRKRPSSKQDVQQLRSVLKTPAEWDSVWSDIEPLPRSGANPEKVSDLHKKILPFIPAEFRSNNLYRAPTPTELEASKAKKRARVQVTKTTPNKRLSACEEKDEKEED